MTTHICIKCGVSLVVGKNTTQYMIDNSHYVCQTCTTKYQHDRREYIRDYRHEYSKNNRIHRNKTNREWKHRTGRSLPMSKNKKCTSFLGVYVTERILSSVFKHVQRMPTNNPGYDFLCDKDYMIDVKSSCRWCRPNHADRWTFHIKKNKVADYFICVAFDNREDLNPEHMWMIPANDVNHLTAASITETSLEKWKEYEKSIDQVSTCCNIMKEKEV